MKLLVAIILAFAAVDAKSFFPKKVFDETYFDKDRFEDIFGKDKEYNTNEVGTFTKPDYYKYFYPGSEGYKNKPSYPYYPAGSKDNTFYDPKETYDFDTFVKYFTSNPFLSQLTKYFGGKDTTYTNFYYPVPKEVVELAKTSKDLKETVNTLVKYYYNLPDDVKAAVNKKYDFDNVVKFILQVYYDIPNVADDLTTYYDIPTAVVAELKTQYDLRKVIYNIVAKYYGFGSFERDYYGKKYFDVKAVVNTLIKVYYGVPKFEYDVEKYYSDPEYFGKFIEGIVSKKYEGIVDSVEGTLERRSRLSDAEKEFYDQFFNFDEYLKFVVKGYYYAYAESTKTPFTNSEYYKKGFYTLVTKIFKYKKSFNGDKYDYVNFDNFYPLEYYFNVLFGYKNTEQFNYNYPTNYYPGNKGYYPYNKNFYDFFKYFYGKYNKEYTPYTGEYPTYNPYYNTYPKNFYEFAKYFNSYYPEEFKYVAGDYKNFEKIFGDYYGKEDTSKYYDYVKKTFDFGKYEPTSTYDYDFTKKPFDTPYNKFDFGFFKKVVGDYYKYKNGGAYNNDESFKYSYGYPYYPTPYNYEKFVGGFSKDVTPKGYYPFAYNKDTTYPFAYNKEVSYPFFKYPTYNKYSFEKYFNNKDF